MSCQLRREQDEFVCAKCARRWPAGEAIDCAGPIGRDVPFTPGETRIFDVMAVGKDTSILCMFRTIDATNRVVDPRRQQQIVGTWVSQINRKLGEHGYEIVPGIARRTYTLKRIAG